MVGYTGAMRKRAWILIALIFVGVFGYVLWDNRNVIAGVLPFLRSSPELPAQEVLPFMLPAGFTAHIYAENVPNARVLARDPRGTLVVSLTSEGKVVALPDDNGDGKADAEVPILENLLKPHGIAFDCPSDQERCTLYVAEEDAVRSYDYDAQTRATSASKKIIDLPSGKGHSTRTLLMHPDGKHLLVSVGSSCNACNEKNPKRASVLSIDLITNAATTFATGLRNTVFMTVAPVTGEVWGTDMGRDLLGDDIPPDEVNIIREGKNYGWPTCYGKNVHDTSFDKNTYIRNPCMEPHEIPSHIDIPAHSAPLGLIFVPGDSSWPKEYRGDLLVAYHGSWNRSVPTGYKIVRMELDDRGNPTGAVEDFMTGFMTMNGEVTGRPAGLLAEPDGLYVSDDRAGVIYKVSRK